MLSPQVSSLRHFFPNSHYFGAVHQERSCIAAFHAPVHFVRFYGVQDRLTSDGARFSPSRGCCSKYGLGRRPELNKERKDGAHETSEVGLY